MFALKVLGNRHLATLRRCVIPLAMVLAPIQFAGAAKASPRGKASRKDGTSSGIQQGMASWHAPCRSSSECRTASNRPWRNEEFVAAHRTLPLGSKVRVVNLTNARSVIVEITDRGPYSRGRIIDVSMAAAKDLGMTSSGVARVSLEVISDTRHPLATEKLLSVRDVVLMAASPLQSWFFALPCA